MKARLLTRRKEFRDEAPYRFTDLDRLLFSELTPARLDLLDILRKAGPSTVYALAKAPGRNYSNVHLPRLDEELGAGGTACICRCPPL